MNPKIEQWMLEKEKRECMGGQNKIDKQHAAGKLTVRERINYLLDPGSFQELGLFTEHRTPNISGSIPADALVCGYGTIYGRPVYVYGNDFTLKGGAFGENSIKKMNVTIRRAIEAGVPLISLNDGAGGRVQEGSNNTNSAEIFYHNVMASGWIPQIAAIMGPCAGGTAYSPALMDFIYMVKNTGNMYLTGPKVIEQVLGEVIDKETLGGAKVHSSITGLSHFVAEDDYDCLDQIKYLLSFLPQNAGENPPAYQCEDDPNRLCPELDDLIPVNPKKPYDIRTIIRAVADNNEFLEVFTDWATNCVTALARLNGKTVGFFANQPCRMAGCLDIDASDKGCRFIRFCDCFNIPVINIADIPGYLPGKNQEYGGIIRHGAKLVYAHAEATVPKITLVVNKFYGGGKAGMCASGLHCDLNFFWPTGQSAIMGAAGAVEVIYAKELRAAAPKERETLRAKYIEEYSAQTSTPYPIMKNFYADEIIRPQDTRRVLIQALELLANKKSLLKVKKKHSNMPV